jgi:hypothetical protein
VTNRLGAKTLEALTTARNVERVTMTDSAMRLWSDVYTKLSEGSPGLLGSITARAEAQTIRLALVYALLDQSPQIDRVHLEAGLALWAYCDASARYIFGDLVGDPVADTILRALRASGGAGMARSEIIGLFGRNLPISKIEPALVRLLVEGKARRDSHKTRGRPAEVWYAV